LSFKRLLLFTEAVRMSASDKVLFCGLLPVALLASAGYAATVPGHSAAVGHALAVLLAGLAFTAQRLGGRVWRSEISPVLLVARVAASVVVASGAGLLSWLGEDLGGLPAATAAAYAALLPALILSNAR
jgi:hypothetical protein